MYTSKFKETAMRIVFLISACVSIIAVVLICVFLFVNGVPAMAEIGFFDFLLGETWRPTSDIYGIMPMILGSIYVTAFLWACLPQSLWPISARLSFIRCLSLP